MRWISGWPSARPPSVRVVGLDVGPDACRLVVLGGSVAEPDRVCCAERLTLPAEWVAHGEVLQPTAFGQWLRAYLKKGDGPPQQAYVGLDGACVTHHRVTIAAGLSPDDVAFQLLADVQAALPAHAADVWIDYALDTEPAPEGEQRYVVQAAPRSRVQALQHVVALAGLKAAAVEPRHDAARRAQLHEALRALPPASAAVALGCDAALGLALRAWHETGINFLPYREDAQHVLRRAWLRGVAACAVGGAFLAAGFAVVFAFAAKNQQPHPHEVVASARAFDQARKAHAPIQAQHERWAEQTRWLKTRQAVQSQTLRWSQVLSQATQGVWVASVQQQGARWTVQGEALSSDHVQRLLAQLKALDIWAQAPELPHLQVVPANARSGLPVWQFRIEADLKVGP